MAKADLRNWTCAAPAQGNITTDSAMLSEDNEGMQFEEKIG